MSRWLAVTTLSIALLGASISTAHACSIAGKLFWTDQERWKDFTRPSRPDGGDWEPIPQPVVEIAKIARGNFSGTPGDCSDIGWLILEISLPANSKYRIADFGVYFRLKRGTAPVGLIQDVPFAGDIEGRKLRVHLYWEDDDAETQAPLDLDVEAFLVAPDLSIGASTVFNVKEKRIVE